MAPEEKEREREREVRKEGRENRHATDDVGSFRGLSSVHPFCAPNVFYRATLEGKLAL